MVTVGCDVQWGEVSPRRGRPPQPAPPPSSGSVLLRAHVARGLEGMALRLLIRSCLVFALAPGCPRVLVTAVLARLTRLAGAEDKIDARRTCKYHVGSPGGRGGGQTQRREPAQGDGCSTRKVLPASISILFLFYS